MCTLQMSVKFGNEFESRQLLSDWLAGMHLYNTDPRHASQWSPKFLKANLQTVSHKVASTLGSLDTFLTCTVKKLTTVNDYRYNIFLNVVQNVCSNQTIYFRSMLHIASFDKTIGSIKKQLIKCSRSSNNAWIMFEIGNKSCTLYSSNKEWYLCWW